MANNNYEVSIWNNSEISGDSMNYLVGDDTINFVSFWIPGSEQGQIQAPILYITPKESDDPNIQYVVSANNFRIGQGFYGEFGLFDQFLSIFTYTNGENGVVLPDIVKRVEFSNTTTANTPSNQVKVTVILYPDFEMPSESILVEIDIDTYGPLETWDPAVSSYRTVVLLTNQIWPNINSLNEAEQDALDVTSNYIEPWTDYRNPPADYNGDPNTYNLIVDNSISAFSIEEDNVGAIPQTIEEYSDALVFWKADYVSVTTQNELYNEPGVFLADIISNCPT